MHKEVIGRNTEDAKLQDHFNKIKIVKTKGIMRSCTFTKAAANRLSRFLCPPVSSEAAQSPCEHHTNLQNHPVPRKESMADSQLKDIAAPCKLFFFTRSVVNLQGYFIVLSVEAAY